MKQQRILTALLFLMLIFTTACQQVAITGRKQLNLVPDSTVNSMALDEYKSFLDENEISPCLVDSTPADFAELLPAVNELEPGDVLVIGIDGELTKSIEPYQLTVVGVYSTRPSYIGGGDNLGQPGYAPLAVVGVVPVKVTTENGIIFPGDLLTTSSTPGHAMRCEGFELCFGATIGKALEGFDGDTGVILMLVVLQ